MENSNLEDGLFTLAHFAYLCCGVKNTVEVGFARCLVSGDWNVFHLSKSSVNSPLSSWDLSHETPEATPGREQALSGVAPGQVRGPSPGGLVPLGLTSNGH